MMPSKNHLQFREDRPITYKIAVLTTYIVTHDYPTTVQQDLKQCPRACERVRANW